MEGMGEGCRAVALRALLRQILMAGPDDDPDGTITKRGAARTLVFLST